jgi:hypothetical protein
MQLADAAEAIAIDAGLPIYFVYYEWMESRDVPMDVTHVRIHMSVRAIKDYAFCGCGQLRIAILNEELEEIGARAFDSCESMEEIVIPDNVRTIEEGAFYYCSGLTRVTLGDGLEEIGEGAFGCCESMEEIDLPDNVRTIKGWAFNNCTGLTRVTLGDGLEEIGEAAFRECTSMVEIIIPPAVRDIHDTAFDECTNLTRVNFCDEIEEFVSSDAMREWWNQGRHEKSLRTYSFLVRCDIPARVSGSKLVSSWKANINDMLTHIPTVPYGDMDAYFDTMDARITFYESWREVPTLLGQIILNNDTVLKILSYF